MDFGAADNGAMIATRAIHFAATAIVTGTLVFPAVVANPALKSQEAAAKLFRMQTRYVAWISLAATVISGLAWVLLLTMSLSDESLGEAITSGALRDVLSLTQFGSVSQVRLALAILLAFCLAFERSAFWRWLGLGAAVGLTASIAWTGHAASTPHTLGYVHLTADVLHLCAAAAWIGGVVSLVLLLAAIAKIPASPGATLVYDAARRFSTLGMLSVAFLVLSGIVNAWILVGSVRGLFVTEYGQLLILKLVIFALMLAFAAVNRFWLTPRLALRSGKTEQPEALRQLARNGTIEIALGLAIFAVVGVLGTQHPAIHLVQ
ncbi:MAG: copper homeostasis membrane protein CopD [Alphaproteobacteria bacterium]|nr:MAG: copper homeostasis membrane protein CopD [Alphaproteobacteria bacterium]